MNNLTLASILTVISSLLFFGTTHLTNTQTTRVPDQKHKHLHFQKHIQVVAQSTCEGTLYPDLCVLTLATFPDLTTKSVPQVISSVVNHTMYEVRSTSYNCSGLKKMLKNLNPLDQRALDDCLKLFEDTSVELKATIDDLSIKSTIGSKLHHDLQTLLSGAMTNLYTCLDGFAYSKGRVGDRIEKKLLQISRHVSNSLAMLNKVPGVEKLTTSSESDEVFPEYGKMQKGFPSWVSSKDRKLLQAKVNETKFNLVVAKDGTGNFTTIGEALSVAPNSSTTRFVIHVTAGAYFENVEVIRKKTNLMFVGDGIGKTVVKGMFCLVFPVILQSSNINWTSPSDNGFVGYQDTLYVHSLRQFYRERDIYGTVDFIFGNAAVVFQNCNLYARKPNENQKNLFMAQGREDPNQNTGISILNCKIAAAADLLPVKSSFKSYLGRPWKMYSMTVVLKSYVDIDPAGWLEWNETFALDTLYYGEYMNRGPCSNTSGRVTWPGYRVINNSTEASQFTVGQFIQDNDWLNNTGIPFFSGLS
ncbi:hypothetical protein JHK87_026531 [Glycine soja]|nr:hypothetical protein JHK87_026531 [Glycine soja]